MTFNQEKCVFHQSSVKFLGHIVNQEGIHADPEKTEAIHQMKAPDKVTELWMLMGMINQLGKFIRNFLIETDHKSLVALLGSKPLPPRVLRFRWRLTRFSYDVVHVPGELLYIVDALSRAHLQSATNNAVLQEEAECILEVSIESLPMSRETLQLYKQSQSKDPICSSVINYSRSGWPKVKSQIVPDLRAYWNVRSLLTIHQDILLYENRLVVPKDMRKRTLQKIHEGYQGIERTLFQAQTVVWWPGLQKEVYNMVKQCQTCAKQNTQTREPLLPTKLPAYPWLRVASDLFKIKGVNFLVVVEIS